MNILILAAGTRNKIVQYFRSNLSGVGKVIATDSSPLAPAIYEADKHYIVPPISDPKYLSIILDICEKEQVSGVLSLIDPELSLLAKNECLFSSIGTKVIGSAYNLCEMSLNKYEMFQWLEAHEYCCPQTWRDKKEFYKAVVEGKIKYPVFVKPTYGSASISISKANDQQTIETLFGHMDDLIIQEYIQGQEIGADVYIDMISKKVVSIFTKKKIKMRAGETDKSVSFKDYKLFELIEKFVTEAGYVGQVDIDLFQVHGNYYILEVNPRFGGGYPHAYECGCNHIKMIINNLEGRINEPRIGCYSSDMYMMKYSELTVRKLT